MRYFIKQKVFTLKDKFNIMNEQQETLYQVEGKVFSIKNKLSLLNPVGDVVLKAEKKLFKLFAEYNILSPDGDHLAKVKRKFALRPKFEVTALGNTLQVDGNFIGHNFTMTENGAFIGNIQKKLFSFGDSYVIDIEAPQNEELYLFIVIIIDQIIEEAEAKRNARN